MLNFEIHADFKAIIDRFKDELSVEVIRSELANAINRGTRKARKAEEEYAVKEYNFSKEVMTKQGRIRTKMARADKDQMTAGLFVSSKPISLRTFVVANKPIAVFVRSRHDMPHAFMVDNAKGGLAGVFMRDSKKPAYAPTKGTYAGRVITRGPRKGQKLLRQGIDKKYTLTTAQVADKGAENAIEHADIVKEFEARLDKRLLKLKAEAAS